MEDRRLETAVELLRHEDLRIREISKLMGCYSNVSVFSRAFTRWSNLQAKTLRQQLQAKSPLPSVPTSEMLTRGFWYPAMLGKLDAEQEYRFCRHVQALYPKSLSLATAESNDSSAPRPERVDGRLLERCRGEEIWQEIADRPQQQQRQRVLGVELRSTEFFDLLVRRSREEGRKDRQRGVDIALLALDTIDASSDLLTEDPAELHARGWAWVQNS